MSTYEHDLDAANTRIEELEAELAEAVSAARLVQKVCAGLRTENVTLKAGKSQGADAAARAAANLADQIDGKS